MCVIDSDYYSEVWKETTHIAKKEHKCDCCHGKINPGEEYLKHFSVYEKDVNYEKACQKCFNDLTNFTDAHNVNLAPSSFVSFLDECVDDGDEDSNRWIPMRESIKERIRVNS